MLNRYIFLSILSFLIGIFLKSNNLNFLILILFFLLFIFLVFYFLFFKKIFLLISLNIFLIIFGAFYYHFYYFSIFKKNNVLFNQKIEFQGIVVSNPKFSLFNQTFKLKLIKPFKGYILVKTNLYPQFKYGDFLFLDGKIKNISYFKNGSFFLKEKIVGIAEYPKIKLLGENYGNIFLKRLFSFKKDIIKVFQSYLKINQAALLSGLILGDTSEFEKDFQEKMNKTGTSHIVALSGYNISIFSILVFNFLRYFLNRYITVFITLILIFSFVLMTGAEASVVRAAIMGLILLIFDNFYGLNFDLKNVLVFTALVMVLFNPFILNFDIGFQLSFLALVGVTFLKKSLVENLNLKLENSFLNYKDNLVTTLSAQLMVLPILLNNFHYFSLFSFLPNIFILTFVPLAMFFGFLLLFFNFFIKIFSLILSWFLYLILSFQIFVIEIFSNFQPIVLKKELSVLSILVYYIILIGVINFQYVRKFLSKI